MKKWPKQEITLIGRCHELIYERHWERINPSRLTSDLVVIEKMSRKTLAFVTGNQNKLKEVRIVTVIISYR